MKRDALLQHQLNRLERMIKAKRPTELSGDVAWLARAMEIYAAAINRSLARFVASL